MYVRMKVRSCLKISFFPFICVFVHVLLLASLSMMSKHYLSFRYTVSIRANTLKCEFKNMNSDIDNKKVIMNEHI